MSAEERNKQFTHLIREIKLSWVGNEELFVRLLRLRDKSLALAIMRDVDFRFEIGELEIGPVDWWLEWLIEKGDDPRSDYWFRDRMV